MNIDVFISHHTDSSLQIVEAIVNKLEANGIRCWYAPRDTQGAYAGSIAQAINSCKVFLLILNKPASESVHVLNELDLVTKRLSRKEEVSVIPFHIADEDISDDAQYYLGRMHWIDAITPPMEERIHDLFKMILAILKRLSKDSGVIVQETIPVVQHPIVRTPTAPKVENVPPVPKAKPQKKPSRTVPHTSGDFEIVDSVLVKYHGKDSVIAIPDGVTKIGKGAFYDCDFLQSVKIPDSVEHIRPYAFFNCRNLETLIIPDSVKRIEGKAFSGCTALVIYVPSECYVESGTLDDCKEVIRSDDFFISFGELIQYSGKGKHLIIPEHVTSISDKVFFNCSSLQSIIIPKTVTSIGNNAFNRCRSLQSIQIPDSVRKIGYWAFSSCKSLQSIHIPDGVTSIGNDAFNSCTSLQSFVIPKGVTSIEDSTFSSCYSLRDVTIPDSVTTIEEKAFSSCKSLQSLTLPKSVKTIKKDAFAGCTKLEIRVPKKWKLKSLLDNPFSGCKSVTYY